MAHRGPGVANAQRPMSPALLVPLCASFWCSEELEKFQEEAATNVNKDVPLGEPDGAACSCC